MKKRVIYLLFVAILLSVSVFSSHSLASKKDTVLSPLSEKAYAKEPNPTSTSTNTPTPTPIPQTPTDSEPTPTPTQTPTPTPVTVPSQYLDDLFNKYSQVYSVEKNILTKIANCESHFNPGAATSLYGGMYQFTESLWISTRNLMGEDSNPDLRFSAEESIKTAAFLISQGHIGKWPACSKL